jgi:hypothetical protein
MKRILILSICLFLSFATSNASPLLSFKISKPICLLTFLETASGDPHSSSTFRTYIKEHMPANDTADFKVLVRAFAALNIDNNYVLTQYPAQRQKPRSSANLIKMAAVQAKDLPDFYSRIAGILPNEQWLALKDVINKSQYFYAQVISSADNVDIEKQLKELKLYNDKTNAAFLKLKTFYGSTWPDNLGFSIAIYPIPGNSGTTTATPHNNSLIMAVLTKETDHDSRMGVAMHEISHVLYEEQPLALQWKLDSAFIENPSLSMPYAYSYIDEALATACGNGWMYELLTGKPEGGAWYNDEYIDKYAHALYPLVKMYIENFKTIDRSFIKKAIATFETQFPDAAYEFNNIFNQVNFYTDANDNEQYRNIRNTLNRYYRVSGCHSSYPIADPQSLDMANKSSGTQLFIIHENKAENFSALKKIFPELDAVNESEESIISFIDKNKRPVVIVNVNNDSRIEAAFKKMTQIKKISPGLSFNTLN